MKKGLGVLFLGIGVSIILSSFKSITGNVVGFSNTTAYLDVLGFVFFLAGLALLVSGKGLEAIMIPTGPKVADKERTVAAMKDFYFGENIPPAYVIISGESKRDSQGSLSLNSQEYQILRNLNERFHIPKESIFVEGQSSDSLNNFMNSIREAQKKGINNLKIATDYSQYKRFKMFYEEAMNEGLINRDFKIEHLDSGHVRPGFVYGLFAYLKEVGKLKEAGSLEVMQDFGKGTSKDKKRWIRKGLLNGGLFKYFLN
jgi:hypothetical protein